MGWFGRLGEDLIPEKIVTCRNLHPSLRMRMQSSTHERLHSHPGQVWYRSFFEKKTQRLWILSLIPYKKITKNMDRLTFTTRIRHWRYSLDWWWELLIGKFPCIEQRKKTSVFTLPETHSKFTTEKLPGPQKKRWSSNHSFSVKSC